METENHFQMLGLAPALAYSDDELRQAFREAGKRAHPDGGGEVEGFETLEAAMRVLLSPAGRLRHWLECQGIEGEVRGEVGGELMEVFLTLGPLLQTVDELLRERDQASSALAKAMLEGRVQEARGELEGFQARLEAMMEGRQASFGAIERGEEDGWVVARDLAFLEKWRGEVRTRYGGLW